MISYPWLYLHFKKIITNYQLGRLNNILLIQSVPGIGEDFLVQEIIRFLMCQQKKGNKICGFCHSCNLLKSNTHPDYYLLNDETKIDIDSIIKLNENLYKSAKLGHIKLVWLVDTSKLTNESLVALLKIIENPPKDTWFFFSCHEKSKFLPIILRSHCFLYYLSVPNESYALFWLEQRVTVLKEVTVTALRLCEGAPVAALKLISSNVWIQREQLCSSLRVIIKNNDWLSLLSMINTDLVLDQLYWLISLLMDALKMQLGISLLNNVDNLILVNDLSCYLNSSILQNIIRDLYKCREQLTTVNSINCELLLINQLLRIEYYLQLK